METRYRILGLDEVIQEGDEIVLPDGMSFPACNGIGNTPRKRGKVYRRPIPSVDPLVAELMEALSGIMPFVEEDYYESCALPPFKKAIEQAREVLLKSRAALTTYETVDGKENKP